MLSWASGQMEKLEVNYRNPTFCHIRCTMNPSMKNGFYTVYVLLEKSSQYTTTIRLHANAQQGKYYIKTFISVLYAHIDFGTFWAVSIMYSRLWIASCISSSCTDTVSTFISYWFVNI